MTTPRKNDYRGEWLGLAESGPGSLGSTGVRLAAFLVDAIAYGAMIRAERMDIPSAIVFPSVVPLPGRGIPPYGLGMAPLRGPLGRVRDAVLWKVVERAFAEK